MTEYYDNNLTRYFAYCQPYLYANVRCTWSRLSNDTVQCSVGLKVTHSAHLRLVRLSPVPPLGALSRGSKHLSLCILHR